MSNKKILLISNKVYHYRIPIYNYFSNGFLNKNIEFRVLTNEIQAENPNPIVFQYNVVKFSVKNYIDYIYNYQPDVVIFFLHLKDWVVWPLIPFLWKRSIPYIYWGHGVNLQDPDNKLKSFFFNILHKYSKAILLYSPDQKKYILKKYHHKVFIAPNTLNFYSFPEVEENKETLKKQFGIPYKKVVLFVGRIQERKRLDVLLEIFSKKHDVEQGLIIAGPDITEEQLLIINNSCAIMYLGALYEEKQINAIFKLSDVFSIPGTMGLGLNQAFFWGLPAVTMKVHHSPEIYYLRNGYNGFIVEPYVSKVEEKLNYLFMHDEILKEYSENAKKTAREEAGIENMFFGFCDAINYSLKKRIESANH